MKTQHEVEHALALVLKACYYLETDEDLEPKDKARIALLHSQIDLLRWVLNKDSAFERYIAGLYSELEGQPLHTQ